MTQNTNNPIDDSNILDYAEAHGFGDLHMKLDHKTGLRAIIAVHSTKLGPALGGCRFIEYPNSNTALYDAMRLARGMSYKAASVNLPLGGGKSVILQPNTPYDRNAYFEKFGEFVDSLGGRYITAMDSGTTLSDMDIIQEKTPYVATCSSLEGDPSPSTVHGILRGIQAAAAFKWDNPELKGLHIAIQGLGHVGYGLAQKLHAMGVKLTVADINANAVARAEKEFNATSVPTESIHAVDCDLFAPCALGGILDDTRIKQLKATVVAGGANNQLAHTYHGQILHDNGILYAPDYVINAGGLIFAADNYLDNLGKPLDEQLEYIYTSLTDIFERSAHEKLPTSTIADTIAQEKLEKTS
ncbi:MAG: amino acid dehydrogenase [Gammaproteobacteria bacterium]|nr:amino acid dehydrogenase [Gammaproteobacteria bacterium]